MRLKTNTGQYLKVGKNFRRRSRGSFYVVSVLPDLSQWCYSIFVHPLAPHGIYVPDVTQHSSSNSSNDFRYRVVSKQP